MITLFFYDYDDQPITGGGVWRLSFSSVVDVLHRPLSSLVVISI